MPLDDRWVSEAIPASTVWAVPRDGYLEQPQTWRKSSAGLVPGKTVSLSVEFRRVRGIKRRPHEFAVRP